VTALVKAKAHATLGASNASRWMNCPGSVALTADLPPSPNSVHAQDGTRAHAVAEVCLRSEQDPQQWLGLSIEGGKVTQEMIDAVQVYLDTCRALRMAGAIWRIEQKFDLASLKPPVPMFGTADFVAYNPTTRTLHVVDFKFGQGVLVEVQDNPQLTYYALGARVSTPFSLVPVDTISLTIVQPRAVHPDGPVRTTEISAGELLDFGVKLLAAANRTQDADAPLKAGKQCRWCPAAGICPEQREHALAVAQSEFTLIDPVPFLPPKPETIPLEEFAVMLSQLHILEDWATAMRQTAQARLERGDEVPGWKLVEKRATRQWTDPEQVVTQMRAAGWDDDEIFAPRTIKSVAQMEKLAGGKSAFADWPITALVEKKSSGLRLAPDSDPAPAVVLSAGSEFPLLPAGSSPGVEGDYE
jgi:hypothetical protein